jgi:hypothetical protein
VPSRARNELDSRSRFSLIEDFRGAVGDDAREVLADVEIAGPPDLVQQLQHRRRRDAVGEADRDRDRLVVDRVHRQVIDAVGLQRHLDFVDRVEQRQFEMQAGAERQVGRDLPEAALAGHLGRLDDDVRPRRQHQHDANEDETDGQPRQADARCPHLRDVARKVQHGVASIGGSQIARLSPMAD